MSGVYRLDEVCEITMGQAPDGSAYNIAGEGWPLIAGAGDFCEGRAQATKFTKEASKLCRPGDIVMAIRASIGEKVIADREYCLGRGVAGLRSGNGLLDERYLWHWLTHSERLLQSKARGATFKQVNREDIGELPITLPPLTEQRRIAGILDKAEALRAKRRAALAKIDILPQAIFLELFGDPFSNREDTIPLGEIAEILMGQSPPGASYNLKGSGTPLLNGPTEFGERHPVEKQWTTSSTRLCEPGDILFCVRGATAGRLNRADKVYCLGRGLAAIRPLKVSPANAEFLFAVLDQYYDYFQARGVGSTFINISRDELERLPIPNAEKNKAQVFARRVEEVEKLKAAQRSSLAKLDALFASLQHRAFRAEL